MLIPSLDLLVTRIGAGLRGSCQRLVREYGSHGSMALPPGLSRREFFSEQCNHRVENGVREASDVQDLVAFGPWRLKSSLRHSLEEKDLRRFNASPFFMNVRQSYNNLTTRGTRVAPCGVSPASPSFPLIPVYDVIGQGSVGRSQSTLTCTIRPGSNPLSFELRSTSRLPNFAVLLRRPGRFPWRRTRFLYQ